MQGTVEMINRWAANKNIATLYKNECPGGFYFPIRSNFEVLNEHEFYLCN